MPLLTVFTEPQQFFAALKDKPHFALPFWLLALGTALVLYLYYQRVDFDWMVDMLLSTEKLGPEEMDAARKGMNREIMSWSSIVLAPLGMLIAFLLATVYYLLAGKIAGVQQGFKAWFAFSVWSSAPLLLSTVVALLHVLTMQSQTLPDALYLTHLDPMLISLPLGHAWRGLSTSVDLLSLWGIALGAIGWRSWTQSGWAQAIVVASLPSLIIYGAWIVFILATR